MSSAARSRITSYVEGFFPPTYKVEVVVCSLAQMRAPLVTITVIAPTKTVVSHHAYQHEVLDVSYMTKVASHLLQVARTGLCVKRSQNVAWCRDSQVIPDAPRLPSAQHWRAVERRAGLQKKRDI